MTEEILTLKILTIGESSVGKTCILRRYVEKKFIKNHLATIGIDFKSKKVVVDKKEYKLKIWDSAGEERFRNITNQYYKGADGIFVVFDVTNLETFDKVEEWIKQIKDNTNPEKVSIVLLGNKIDLPNRKVSEKMAKERADSYKIQYFETSALTGLNVEESFQHLAEEIIKRKKHIAGTQNGINLKDAKKKEVKKNGCC